MSLAPASKRCNFNAILAGAPSPLLAAAPHSVTQDDEYRGMKIPKGSSVVLNVSLVKYTSFSTLIYDLTGLVFKSQYLQGSEKV